MIRGIKIINGTCQIAYTINIVPNNERNKKKNSRTFSIRIFLVDELRKIVLISFCKTGVISNPCLRSYIYQAISAIKVPTTVIPNPCAIEIYNEAPSVSTATIKLGTVTTHKVERAYAINRAVLL